MNIVNKDDTTRDRLIANDRLTCFLTQYTKEWGWFNRLWFVGKGVIRTKVVVDVKSIRVVDGIPSVDLVVHLESTFGEAHLHIE